MKSQIRVANKLPWPIPLGGYLEDAAQWFHLPSTDRTRGWHVVYAFRVRQESVDSITYAVISAYKYERLPNGRLKSPLPFHKLEETVDIPSGCKEVPEVLLGAVQKVKAALANQAKVDERAYERRLDRTADRTQLPVR